MKKRKNKRPSGAIKTVQELERRSPYQQEMSEAEFQAAMDKVRGFPIVLRRDYSETSH